MLQAHCAPQGVNQPAFTLQGLFGSSAVVSLWVRLPACATCFVQPMEDVSSVPSSGAMCVQDSDNINELTGHVIMCGAEESFCTFLEQLRRVEPQKMPVVLLHPTWNQQLWESLSTFGPIFFIRVRGGPVGHSLCLTAQGVSVVLAVEMWLRSAMVLEA